MTTFSETTLPALIFSVPAGHPKGDVPALGRLTVNEAQAVDQAWMIWGCETNDLYTHTDSTGSGALFYEAESRTVQGGAAIASASGVNASPAGSTTNNIVRHTALTTEYTSLLSTQATGGGSHLSHAGSFRVLLRARISAAVSTETVSVAFEWSYGDFRRFARNDAAIVTYADLSQWRLLDLGIVTIPRLVGTQRWEGRVVAKSTSAGTDLDLDCIMLIPVDVASGEAAAVPSAPSPTGLIALDNFNQTAGALTGKTAETGGVWVGAGDTDDFSVSGSGTVTRAATSDTANIGRYGTLDVNQSGVYVQAQTFWTVLSQAADYKHGIIARYADTNNWAMADIFYDSGVGWFFEVRKRVAGTITTIKSVGIGTVNTTVASSDAFPMSLQIDSGGRFTAILTGSVLSGVGNFSLTGQDADLVTSGTLGTGDIGIYAENQTASANSFGFSSIQASAYLNDAAIFASQSLEVRHDQVIREDSAGAIWQPVSSYEGDFSRVPVTGREGRSVRFIVKASRNDPATGYDTSIDDISATLAYTPRYLSVPAPA